jgi:zinc transport system permease protein
MSDFFHALSQYAFLQIALLTGILVSVACGVVGTYVVTRRISFIAGAIAHCVLGGLGWARYCQVVYGWAWCEPMLGAVLSALAAALLIGAVSLRAKEREDTLIGAIWAVGMAVGLLFIYKTPGYNEDLLSYLFGNILLVSRQDLYLILLLDAAVVALSLAFYRQFLAVCFDEEFARLRGLRVEMCYMFLLCIIALTVVLLIKVVGTILVIALLTLPVAIAGQFTRTLGQMMVVSMAVSALVTSTGLALSYGPSLPCGAVTIVVAALLYLIVVFVVGPVRASRARAHAGTSSEKV